MIPRDRMKELALAAADALDQAMDPFSTSWLVEHNVTADECMALSQEMAEGLRMLW